MTNHSDRVHNQLACRLARARAPDPVDIHVGHRIKLRRTILHVSQEHLAACAGVTFQQIQKYESGANRISASRLYHVSRALSCPVAYFFEDIGFEIAAKRSSPASGNNMNLADGAALREVDPM